MSHEWVTNGTTVLNPHPEGPPDVRIRWLCEKCGASCLEKRMRVPDPDMAFWKGVASEVEVCEEMTVDAVHDL